MIHTSRYKMNMFWGLMCSIVTTVNDTVLHLKVAKRVVDLKSSHHAHKHGNYVRWIMC